MPDYLALDLDIIALAKAQHRGWSSWLRGRGRLRQDVYEIALPLLEAKDYADCTAFQEAVRKAWNKAHGNGWTRQRQLCDALHLVECGPPPEVQEGVVGNPLIVIAVIGLIVQLLWIWWQAKHPKAQGDS